MSELDWHNCTVNEEHGAGYEFILDVCPGWKADQAAEYKGQALVRTGKNAWNWWARCIPKDKKKVADKPTDILGEAEFRDIAVEDGLKALDQLMQQFGGLDIKDGIEIRR